MTLKWGSLKSFFIAALRTPASTPGAMKRVKSDPRVSAATSASVGAGGCGAVSVASAAGTGSLRTTSGVATFVDGTADDGIAGAAVDGASSRSSTGAAIPALRRDQRAKNPSSLTAALLG